MSPLRHQVTGKGFNFSLNSTPLAFPFYPFRALFPAGIGIAPPSLPPLRNCHPLSLSREAPPSLFSPHPLQFQPFSSHVWSKKLVF